MTTVMDRVYLGNREDARDTQLVISYGITHVGNCAGELLNYHAKSFIYCRMETNNPDPKFDQLHGQVRMFIDEGRAKGSVLVHSRAGLSRSPSAILAFMTCTNKLAWKKRLVGWPMLLRTLSLR